MSRFAVIKVSIPVKDSLDEIKQERGLSSMNDVIAELLKMTRLEERIENIEQRIKRLEKKG